MNEKLFQKNTHTYYCLRNSATLFKLYLDCGNKSLIDPRLIKKHLYFRYVYLNGIFILGKPWNQEI